MSGRELGGSEVLELPKVQVRTHPVEASNLIRVGLCRLKGGRCRGGYL